MKKTAIAIIAFLITGIISAQKIDIKWSDMQMYSNKEDGFFSSYIGGNNKYVYAMFSNATWGTRKQRFKFVAFDAQTMKKVSDVTVIDRRKSEEKKKYEGLNYYRTIIFEDVLYVFWTKENKEKDELFVQSFDAKLKPINKLKKIYELSSGKKAMKKAELFVMGNKNNSQSLIIGGELSGEKGQNVKVEYKVMKSDFTFGGAGQQALPVIIAGRSDFLSSSYEFGDDGNLHVQSTVYIPKEERKSLKKGESSQYRIYTIIDVVNNTQKAYPLKFDSKNIFDMGVQIDKDVIKIFGFFCDLNKDSRGDDTHGIFYTIVNPQTKELDKVNFSYFTKEQLDKLFEADKADRKDKHLFAGKKKKKSEEESLGSLYEIENVQSIDKDNLVLVCSMMRNYTTRTCDSKGNCTTQYWCEKRNVTTFKIDKSGAIVWASNLNRTKTYGGWDVKDVNVICPDGKYLYVTYGSERRLTKEEKKSGKYKLGHFEYAVFDYNNGNYKFEQYAINEPKTPKKERKTISPLSIQVVNNKFFVNSTHIGYKTGYVIGACATSLVCWPVGAWMLLNGNGRKGTGYLGAVGTGK